MDSTDRRKGIKAIELLSDCCDRGSVTLDQDFKEAVRIGKKALQLLLYDKAHRLSDLELDLLLDLGLSGNLPVIKSDQLILPGFSKASPSFD